MAKIVTLSQAIDHPISDGSAIALEGFSHLDPVAAGQLPLSVADSILAKTGVAVVSVPELFNDWLQPGWIDVRLIGAGQVERMGNINSTVIGVIVADARAATGWNLAIAANLAALAPPTDNELAILRGFAAAKDASR